MAKKFKHLSSNSAEFLHEFRRLLAERPEISDEEFMRETEAPVGPDGEYLWVANCNFINNIRTLAIAAFSCRYYSRTA